MPPPIARLTSTYLESLKSGPKAYDVGDPAVPGLLIRIYPWGTKNWLFRYTWNKTPVRLTLKNFPQRTIKQAHELALKYRDLLDRGIDPRKADRSLVVGNGAAKAR